MTDTDSLSNFLPNDNEMDAVLSELESAFKRFEKIIAGRVGGSRANGRPSIRGKTANTIVNSSLSRIFDLMAGQTSTSSTTNTGLSQSNVRQNNRFLASTGQFMTDLAQQVQRFSGRNL